MLFSHELLRTPSETVSQAEQQTCFSLWADCMLLIAHADSGLIQSSGSSLPRSTCILGQNLMGTKPS